MTDLRKWLALFESGATPASRSSLLLELDWHDKSPMEQVLKRWKGKYIHFTNGAPNRKPADPTQLIQPPQGKPAYYDKAGTRAFNRSVTRAARMNAVDNVPKLGINPSSMWRDPKGIYFYPVNHLLGHAERITSGQQYGFSMRYYYVAEVNLNAPNGVVLQRVSWEQIEAIARRNGWIEQMETFRAQEPAAQQKQFPSYSDPSRPGNFLWHFVERLERDGQITWNKAFRGISFIRDENGSVIHSNEPDQVVVFDPSVIKVLEMGETKAVKRDADNLDQWRYAMTNVMKAVRGEFGGDLAWKEKLPILSFKQGMGTFSLSMSGGWNGAAMSLKALYGRAEDTETYIKQRDLETLSLDQIVEIIAKKVRKIASLKTDLLFKPALSIDAAQAFAQDDLIKGVPLSFKVSITNDAPAGTVYIHGDGDLTPDGVSLSAKVGMSLQPDGSSFSVTSSVYGRPFGWNGDQTRWMPEEHDAMLDAMATSMAESLNRSFEDLHPSREKRNSWERFQSEPEWSAFRGWYVRSCGMTLGGRLEALFSDAIRAYEAYPDKKALHSEISYRLNVVFKRH